MPSKNNIRRTPGNAKYGEPGQSDGFFRKAGDRLKGALEAIQRFDQRYSDKINAMYANAPGQVRSTAAMIGGGLPAFKRAEVERDYGPETYGGMIQRNAVEIGLPIANAGVKYVLPAAGVTLAGKGLIDIGSALAQSGDQQTADTMPMY